MRYAPCRAAAPCLIQAASSGTNQRLFCWDGFCVWHGSAVRPAARCKDSDNAESALLQTVAHLADPQRVGSAMRNFSLDAAINSTQKVGNKVKQLFWAGKLGRSSSYVLESSGLHQSTGTNVSRKSSWLERSAGLVGRDGACMGSICKTAWRAHRAWTQSA